MSDGQGKDAILVLFTLCDYANVTFYRLPTKDKAWFKKKERGTRKVKALSKNNCITRKVGEPVIFAVGMCPKSAINNVY